MPSNHLVILRALEALLQDLAPGWEREHRFAARSIGLGNGLRDRLAAAGLRDWRFDFAHLGLRLAVEVEGGAWSGGRHARGAGFAADLRKYSKALALGWVVYRCDYDMITRGEAINDLTKIINRLRHDRSL